MWAIDPTTKQDLIRIWFPCIELRNHKTNCYQLKRPSKLPCVLWEEPNEGHNRPLVVSGILIQHCENVFSRKWEHVYVSVFPGGTSLWPGMRWVKQWQHGTHLGIGLQCQPQVSVAWEPLWGTVFSEAKFLSQPSITAELSVPFAFCCKPSVWGHCPAGCHFPVHRTEHPADERVSRWHIIRKTDSRRKLHLWPRVSFNFSGAVLFCFCCKF